MAEVHFKKDVDVKLGLTEKQHEQIKLTSALESIGQSFHKNYATDSFVRNGGFRVAIDELKESIRANDTKAVKKSVKNLNNEKKELLQKGLSDEMLRILLKTDKVILEVKNYIGKSLSGTEKSNKQSLDKVIKDGGLKKEDALSRRTGRKDHSNIKKHKTGEVEL